MKSRLLLLAFGLAVGLLIAEVALRSLGFGRPVIYRAHPQLHWVAEATDAFAPSYGVEYRFNRFGWRNAPVALPKPAGRFRALLLGDSIVFGQGVPFEATLAQRLEKQLAVDFRLPCQSKW